MFVMAQAQARIAPLIRRIENSEWAGTDDGGLRQRDGPGRAQCRCSKAHDVLEISISHGRRITRRLATHDDGTKADQSAEKRIYNKG